MHLTPKYFFFRVNKSLHLFETRSSHHLLYDRASKGHGSTPGLTSQTDLNRSKPF